MTLYLASMPPGGSSELPSVSLSISLGKTSPAFSFAAIARFYLRRPYIPHLVQLGAAGAKHLRHRAELVQVALHLRHRRVIRAGDEVDRQRHGREGHVHLLGERDATAVELRLELDPQGIDVDAVLFRHLVRDHVGAADERSHQRLRRREPLVRAAALRRLVDGRAYVAHRHVGAGMRRAFAAQLHGDYRFRLRCDCGHFRLLDWRCADSPSYPRLGAPPRASRSRTRPFAVFVEWRTTSRAGSRSSSAPVSGFQKPMRIGKGFSSSASRSALYRHIEIGPSLVATVNTQASIRSCSSWRASMKLWMKNVSLRTLPPPAARSRFICQPLRASHASPWSRKLGRRAPCASSTAAERRQFSRSMGSAAVSSTERSMNARSSSAS